MEDSKSNDFLENFFLNSGFSTRALHAGEHVGQPQQRTHTGGIYQSSTFVFESAAEGAQMFAGETPGYVYTRLGNPTVMLLEAKMNALEGKEVKLANPNLRVSSLAFSSGMAAISSAILGLCSKGDTVIVGDVLYGCTEHLVQNVFPRFGIKSVEVDTTDLNQVETVLKANPDAKMFVFETPTNPTLAITDIKSVCELCNTLAPGIKTLVDNTFATPYLQKPLLLGANAVAHSTTKYLCGHGTVVGGILTTTDDIIKDVAYDFLKDTGGSPSPFDAWLVNMGIKTLPIRMEKHCSNAASIAEFLHQHSKVERVFYPGLPDTPAHDLAKKQMSDFGGMVSFEIAGGFEPGRKLMDRIEIFTLAVSLGCVDSLIQHPASMTHACVEPEKRLRVGVTDGLIRLSVGIEDIDDLITALDEALKKV